MMKKILMIIIPVLLIATLFLTSKKNVAQTGEYSVTISNQKVTVGQEFTVLITVNSSIPLDKIDAYISYDSECVEFVSEEKSVVGTGGMLELSERFEEPVQSAKYSIRMKALQVGSTKINITDIFLEEASHSDIIAVESASAQIEIDKKQEKAKDANLNTLKIFPGELNKEFHPDVKEYDIQVASDVEEIILSAEPLYQTSVVTIEKPDVLEFGKNKIVITVTAESGNQTEYLLNVTRSNTEDDGK